MFCFPAQINELLHSQNNAILNLNDRIGQITNEVQAIKEPLLQKMMKYDTIGFSYSVLS